MTTKTPATTGLEAVPESRGQFGDSSAAPLSPSPPPYKGGQGQGPAPIWLAQHIADTRRTASPDTCPRCGADTLTGPDHDTVAATVHLDPRPVDALTEVVALLTGHHTYQLTRNRIEHREPENIHAALNDKPIHVNHKCGEGQ